MKRLVAIGMALYSLSSPSFASNIKLVLPPLDEVMAVSDISLSQIQAKIYCRFEEPQSKKSVLRERYILTRLDRIEEGRYRVRTGKAKLNAWVPEHHLIGCGYNLITLGEDLEGNPLIGEIVLLNSGLGKQNASLKLKRKLASLVLGKLGNRDSAYLGDIIQD